MKWISIQLHTDKSHSIEKQEVVNVITETGALVEVIEEKEGESYTSLNFKVTTPKMFWSEKKVKFLNCLGFPECSIVVCEGESGWDDYLLLYHFDSSEKCDDISLV